MQSKNIQAFCYAQLPRAGLGNMMLVWARALVFAHLNDLPLAVSGWSQARIGSFLRGERSKRLYLGYFKPSNNINFIQRALLLQTYDKVIEPDISSLPLAQKGAPRTVYVFRKMPHWSDYFDGVKNYRNFVRDSLYEMLSRKHNDQVSTCDRPVIGVHVRRGDFRELQPGENISETGLTRTPLSYFKNLIASIRSVRSEALPVTIFSDGNDDELAELLSVPNVRRADNNSDIADLLLLSRSKLIITSRSSTFSYWAAFLADAPVILHPDHGAAGHPAIRPRSINRALYEGSAEGETNTWPELLVQNIKSITV